MVTPEEKDRLLKNYWSIPERQVTKLDLVHNPDLVGDVSSQFKPASPFKFLPAGDGENWDRLRLLFFWPDRG
jgi:hypothetical protein